MASGLVRDVVERHNNSASSAPQQPVVQGSGRSSKMGFPAVQHRSKATSAFKRARQDERVQSGLSDSRERFSSVPKVRNDAAEGSKAGEQKPRQAKDWIEDISRSNAEAVASMSADEREQERADVVDRFGAGINDLMTKVRDARERRAARSATAEAHDTAQNNTGSPVTSAQGSTPPSPRARAARKIRFVEPTEADVHVYESQPSSPKRTLALLPPPPEDSQERSDISSLGSFKGSLKPQETLEEAASTSPTVVSGIELPEEGTPEDIRRRFFPSEASPETNPALAWMLPSSASSPKPTPLQDSNLSPAPQQEVGSDAGSVVEPRYSLSGIRLSHSQINSLPTHLGLHHHASAASSSSDAPAGYTLSDLLLLARSSVPAQRASILGMLAKILRATREHIYRRGRGPAPSSLSDAQKGSLNTAEPDHDVDLDAMRRDVLDAAIDALGEKGGVGQRAVDVLWEAVVGFTPVGFGVGDPDDIPRVDLTPASLPPPPSAPSSSHSSSKPTPKSPPVSSSSSPFSTAVLVSVPLASFLPALTSHLIASPSPLSRTHAQVLDVLLVLSHFAHHARTIVSPNAGASVVAAMMGPHLRPSFGPGVDDEEMRATPTAIYILQVLARSSRDNAARLMGPADILLRYVTVPLPPLNSAQPQSDESRMFRLSLDLLAETLRFYTLLSEYGLYAQVATTAQEHFARIGAWLLTVLHSVADPAVTSLSRAYLRLLETLIVCATNPHRTTPGHDILWSQIQGWGWGDWTIDFAELLAAASKSISPPLSSGLRVRAQEEHGIEGLWVNVCRAAAVWVEGASVNGIKGGEAERAVVLARLQPLFENGREGWRLARDAVATLRVWQLPLSLNIQTMGELRKLADAADLVAAIFRLALACIEPGAGRQPFDLPVEDIREVCLRFSGGTSTRGPFDHDKWNEAEVPEHAHAFARPVSTLLVLQLQFWRRSMAVPMVGTPGDAAENEEWTAQALRVLGVLIPGDEEYGKWIIESLCDGIDPNFVQKVLPSTDIPPEIWDKGGVTILLPFLTHSLRPTTTRGGEDEGDESQPTYFAPISSTPESIAQCTTLNLPSLSNLRAAWESNSGGLVLPLRNNWPMLPLNHLLRSGTSPVFHALPPSWDASETDVVRATLLLMRTVQEVGGRGNADTHTRVGLSRVEAIFACMKVFMLEHGQQQCDSGEEVFRDSLVNRWMEDLLEPFTYANARKVRSYRNTQDHDLSLEDISKSFLGPGTPFYQFYTDFLALYDAISFSHPLFGRLLLPPVSMAYPIDYRKLLFGDVGHVLRTVKTDIQNVFCGDVREYLWPVEHDAHVIGWYLKALVKSNVQGFVRWVAVHHVAANIWPEFRGEDGRNQERAGKLLSAVLLQGSTDVVREVAVYRQPEDEAWVPPRCFMPGETAWRERRLEWAESIGDERAKMRLQSLFLD